MLINIPKDIKLEAAVNIPGFMQFPELLWLAKEAKKHRFIVEIGTFFGKSTRAMADNTKGVVVTIDDFQGPRDASMAPYMRDNLFDMFVNWNSDLLQTGKIIAIVESSQEAVVDFSPDMLFIDGSHLYEDVKRDIELWLPRMARGGRLCGHDYTNMEDVRRAVQDTVGKCKVAKHTSIWYVDIA